MGLVCLTSPSLPQNETYANTALPSKAPLWEERTSGAFDTPTPGPVRGQVVAVPVVAVLGVALQ